MYRFNTASLFCSSGTSSSDQTSSGTVRQLSRIQSANIEINLAHEAIDYLDEQTELERVERPVVDLSFEYLATNGNNERNMGLVTDGYNSAFYRLSEDKNYYLVVGPANSAYDLNFDTGNLSRQCFGVGNVVLNSYAVSASVGGFVRANVSAQGYNLTYYTGVSGENNPGLNIVDGSQLSGIFVVPLSSEQSPEYSLNSANDITALSYQDLIMEFPENSALFVYLSGAKSSHLQSFNLSFSVNRGSIKSLGDKFPRRPVDYPLDVELTAEAFIEEYQAANLNQLNCYDTGYDINIIVKQPCSNYLALEYYLRGLKLESFTANHSVGQNATVNFRWRGRVPGNLQQSGSNLFIVANGGTESYIVDSFRDISGNDQLGNQLFFQEIIWKRILNENFFTP